MDGASGPRAPVAGDGPQAGAAGQPPGQAERRARPFCRRARRTARPARVDIRARKPWRLARFLTFG
jgi:hypothetical protein